MSQYTLCDGKYHIDSSRLNVPHPASQFEELTADQLPAEIARCFEHPIDFPAIGEAVLPDDSIAIAVAPNTPCGLTIARLMAEWFSKNGSDPSKIHIVCSESETDIGDDCQVHDPTDEQQMAYLLADRGGQPVHINRFLFDADVVVPVGSCDGREFEDSICPWFLDDAAQKNMNRLSPAEFRGSVRMVDENLGVFWQMKLVTAPGNRVVKMLVGANEPVIQNADRLGSAVWNVDLDQSFDLIVATMESASCQTWRNIRRAILNADKLANDDAAILLCGGIARKPEGDWPADSDDELTGIFGRRHIYLASGLNQDSTEQSGFGYVENSEQIQKLIDQHKSILLLRDAHKVGLSAPKTLS